MDIPKPDNFNETYLYEGLATRHLKITTSLMLIRVDGMRFGRYHQIRAASHRRPFPVFHLPDPVRLEVHTFCECAAPRSKAWKSVGQCRL